MSDSEDEILAGRISDGRRLRRRTGARSAVIRAGGRLRDDSETEQSNGSDSGSEIEQPVRKRKPNKAVVEEDDEAGPSGLHQQQVVRRKEQARLVSVSLFALSFKWFFTMSALCNVCYWLAILWRCNFFACSIMGGYNAGA